MSKLNIVTPGRCSSSLYGVRYQIVKLNPKGVKNSVITNLILGDLIDLNNKLSKKFPSEIDLIPLGRDKIDGRISLIENIYRYHPNTYSLINAIAPIQGDLNIESLDDLTEEDLIDLSITIRVIMKHENII